MVQFNLLPDVKLQYLKAERTRRLVISVSLVASVASLALLLLLVSVTQLQKKHLSDLSKNIKADSAKLENQPDISKILTVQNQLNSLTNLHNSKPAVSRLFPYLAQLVPTQADIGDLSIDMGLHTVTLTGGADSLSTVNKFVDTLKFTDYSVQGDSSTKKAFSNVVLSNFGLSDNKASYTIIFAYDPTIFDITQTVSLSVPNQITTRSEMDKPNDLFVAPTTSQNKGQ